MKIARSYTNLFECAQKYLFRLHWWVIYSPFFHILFCDTAGGLRCRCFGADLPEYLAAQFGPKRSKPLQYSGSWKI
jgi:hypothetical protein